MRIKKGKNHSFVGTIEAHGWYSLAPFEYDEKRKRLAYAFEVEGQAVDIVLTASSGAINVTGSDGTGVLREAVIAGVKRVLRIDEDFGELHRLISRDPGYRWIAERNMGPMLRSSTVYEDLVKTICTTNCTWALTKTMVGNLVEKLGERTPSGRRAFPGPEIMSRQDSDFYSDQIRAGYRGPYLLELAERVCSGDVDPESWLESELPTGELKKEIKKIKGVGDYSAEHILKLIGRYDGLALDSFLRSCFYQTHNKGKPCTDKKIAKHYSSFGAWKGLVIWFEMVEERRKRKEEADALAA